MTLWLSSCFVVALLGVVVVVVVNVVDVVIVVVAFAVDVVVVVAVAVVVVVVTVAVDVVVVVVVAVDDVVLAFEGQQYIYTYIYTLYVFARVGSRVCVCCVLLWVFAALQSITSHRDQDEKQC